jgi:hypothetical protein
LVSVVSAVVPAQPVAAGVLHSDPAAAPAMLGAIIALDKTAQTSPALKRLRPRPIDTMWSSFVTGID